MFIFEKIGTVLEALCRDFCKTNSWIRIEEFEKLGLVDISSEDDSLLPVNEGLMNYGALEKIRLIDFSMEDDSLLCFQANALQQSSKISDGELLLEENSQEEKATLDSIVQREEEFSDSEYLTPQSFRQSSPSTGEMEGRSTQYFSDTEYFTPQSCRRRSFTWDDAFFTSRGLLNPEELCSIHRGYMNFNTRFVGRKLEDSFEDIANSQSKVKLGGRRPNSTSQTKRTCSAKQCKMGTRNTKASQGQPSSASKKPAQFNSAITGIKGSQASKSARQKNDPKSSTASILSTHFITPQKPSSIRHIKSKSSTSSKYFSSSDGSSSRRFTKSSSFSSSTSSLNQASTASRSSLCMNPLRHICLENTATQASHSRDQLVKDTSIRSSPNSSNSSKGFKPSQLRKPYPRFGFFDLERAIMPIKLDFDYDFT